MKHNVFDKEEMQQPNVLSHSDEEAHGTGTGGWVQGRDYINPAIQPVFDRIADEAWKEVTKI